MKWFLNDVAYSVWLALDHPEDWKDSGAYNVTYRGVIDLWTGYDFRIEHPVRHDFGWIDKIILKRKFKKMKQRQLVGEFTKAILE